MAVDQSIINESSSPITITDAERQALFECITLTFPCFLKSHYPRELCGFTKALLKIRGLCCELLILNNEPAQTIIDMYMSRDDAHVIKLGLEQLHKASYPAQTNEFLDAIKYILMVTALVFGTTYEYKSVEHEHFSINHMRVNGLLTEISFHLAVASAKKGEKGSGH